MISTAVRAQARVDGYNAFNSGKTERDNPYEVGTEAHAVWLAGFEQADFEVFSRKRFMAEANMTPAQKFTLDSQEWIRTGL